MTEAPTRGEFDLLKQIITTAQMGPSVAVVQSQLTDLAKDVVRLEAEMDKRFDEHVRVHVQDQRDRLNGRRWMIGTVITVLVLLVAILSLVANTYPRR